MSILSLSVAKAHLRVTSDAHDGDINDKLEAAEAIILNYLKNRSMDIDSVSIASPAEVTTAQPHSLVSGATYTIGGTSTTPSINGARVVTVTGPTTFTVPVAVTVGEDDSDGTVSTPAWAEDTLPGQTRAAILIMLTHLYEHRGDLMTDVDEAAWLAIERLLMRSRDPALA